MGHDFPGYVEDVRITLDRNPAGQISTIGRNNDAYAWTGAYTVNRPYTTNGLNQYSAAGTANFAYDANGNLISDGTNTYTYDVENRLVGRSPSSGSGGTGGVTLAYDPLGRLYEVTGSSSTTRFLYDGDALVAEYDGTGAMTRRYVHNEGADVPLLSYAGSTLTQLSYLHADHQGSIVAVSNASGASAINTYDEYGIPGAANTGRFQYTGQAWTPELGMYHYKARIYSPTLGRFLQTDPVGYEDQFNLYAYVGNDPVNSIDPEGTDQQRPCAVICRVLGGPVPIRSASGVEVGTYNHEAATFGMKVAAITSVGIGVAIVGGTAALVGAEALAGGTATTGLATTTEIRVSRSAHPQSAAHIERAQAAGHPRTLTVDRASAAARRREALRGTPPRRGLDRDEYPPAMTREGGRGASVERIPRSDNRGSGASMGHQCRLAPNGGIITIVVCN